MQFFHDIFVYDFLRRALLASILVSASCGVLGAYVVARRGSYMVGAVSHSLLGGIGLARYCQAVLGLAFFTPGLGAVLAAVIVSSLVSILSIRGRFSQDTLLSAVWTVGVAAGLCFITAIPGYAEDLNSYLFGNILLVSRDDLMLTLALDVIILPVAWLFHNRFLALCFHEEGLALRGISPFVTSLMLNILTGLAVVMLSQVVGVVMVLALMVLPASTATLFARGMRFTMLAGGAICLFACLAGMAISYSPNWPTGAIIILTAATIYATTAAATTALKRLRTHNVAQLR